MASLAVVALASAAACASNDATGVVAQRSGTITLPVGAATDAASGKQVMLAGDAGGGEYVLVVTDTNTSGASSAYQIAVTGTAAAGTISAPASTRPPSLTLTSQATGIGAVPLDVGYGARLNERYRKRFQSLLRGTGAGATLSMSRGLSSAGPLRRTTSSAQPQVGDIVTYNVSADPCDTIVDHATRIVAIGTNAIIAVDTLDPPGGFSTADYRRFAANFDTLVYPLDVGNFGAPSDIDQNGHIVLLFTRAVNELTPPRSESFVGGFFFARDLFPTVATQRLEACRGSNEAEMFYLLAPDPTGAVNSNIRTAGFVDSLTTSVIGHEFQHLINASRRIFVNNANDLEEVWLNEGLSHIAEELLFYRQSGLGPRQNLTASAVRASSVTRVAFNQDQSANAARYRDELLATSTNSPIRNDDSLATRGATWNFLRYAADRKLRGGGQDADVFQALVNSTTTGVANLRAVFGADLGGWLRDWSVSHYTDDIVPGAASNFAQPSWNWHDLYPALGGGGGAYPLQILSLPTTGASGSLIPGAFATYRFAIPANGTATVTVSSAAANSGLPIGTIMRIR
jgi:hypothetical protein